MIFLAHVYNYLPLHWLIYCPNKYVDWVLGTIKTSNMCHYLTSNRQFSLLAAPLPLSAVPPPQSAESSRLWVFYYCELPKYFYISTELFFGTNLFSVYWHRHGGQGDSKPSQVRLWKRDKWGCWGWSYSSYTQNATIDFINDTI